MIPIPQYGTGVASALAISIGSAGSVITFGGNAGTPSALVGTNITGTASGLTAGNVTTNANLTGPITSSGNATSIASQTGTGTKFVMDTSPVLVTPNIGTPSAGTLTNCTGLPVSSGITGFGTGVATALGVNVGSAGAFITFNGALGTPSSGTVTNLTGTASININGTVGATTPASGTFTDLSFTGNGTFGDAAADTITFNAQNLTLPLRLIFTKTAQTGVAETLCTWTVSDDTSSTFAISNGSATDATFTPKFQGTQSGTGVACNFTGQGTTDTGTSPLLVFVGQIGTSTDVATRPVVVFRNRATDLLTLNATNLTFKDAYDLVFNTSTGSKFGTGTTQKMGWWNATPVVQSTGWGSITNVTPDKVYNANATTIDEIADVLGTLVAQLVTYGILGS